jgi:hypothetical protein
MYITVAPKDKKATKKRQAGQPEATGTSAHPS